MNSLLMSMVKEVHFPDSKSGLCFESDYGLLRLLPTKRDPVMRNEGDFPSWLSQRRGGESQPPKQRRQRGQSAVEIPPPAFGAWPTADQDHLWDSLPTHRDDWSSALAFNGRVRTRFSHRIW